MPDLSHPRPEDNDLTVPNIPAGGETVTSPFRVELTPDGTGVRIGTRLAGRTVVTNRRELTFHDLDPTEALWLSTMIRAHAEAVIAEQVAARRATAPAPAEAEYPASRAEEAAYNRAHSLPDNAAPVGMYRPRPVGDRDPRTEAGL